MRLLVDTHVLLWALTDPDRLSPDHRGALGSASNEVFFSAASIWEIAIKSQLKRSSFSADAGAISALALESRMRELPISAAVAAQVARLPLHHADPFDRLLIAQALDASLTLVSVDAQVMRYSDLLRVM